MEIYFAVIEIGNLYVGECDNLLYNLHTIKEEMWSTYWQ